MIFEDYVAARLPALPRQAVAVLSTPVTVEAAPGSSSAYVTSADAYRPPGYRRPGTLRESASRVRSVPTVLARGLA